jgi:preprotein translocase subunit SecA
MRIFAGEWVKNLLTRLGMKDGEAIESRMVSRRISAAQKKVEERNFDSRKHLLEYDEVMDHQRKEVYGYRQRILNGANCKALILGMYDRQIELAVNRFLDADYGAASFAEFASNRLSVEFDASDFARSDYTEAEKTAHDKAHRSVGTQVQEALEENLGAEDPKEWNWQALAHAVNNRWGLKTADRQLKQIGKDNLGEFLIAEGTKAVEAVDLSEGQEFLQSDWGVRSLCDWARLKYGIKLTPEELAGKDEVTIRGMLRQQVLELYHDKQVEFPVTAAVLQHMTDRGGGYGVPPGGQRYDREGLYRWAVERFPEARERLSEEEFRTQSRQKLMDLLQGVSRSAYPAKGEETIDTKLEEEFEGSRRPVEGEDARDLAEWVKAELGLEVSEAQLTGKTVEQAREVLWNAFDARYRPEMRQMERSLVLNQLDQSWKNHLYQMDHLRSGIGLVGYAQEDPKTVYKQEGMKEFRSMWEGVEDKVTEALFRMEETEAFQETLWVIGSATHASASSAYVGGEEGSSGGEARVTEPIRNRGARVGRNDPCPCGSGKKYKNCHMRQAV